MIQTDQRLFLDLNKNLQVEESLNVSAGDVITVEAISTHRGAGARLLKISMAISQMDNFRSD